MTPYSALLKDPRWQRKRLERMNASGFECDNCGDGTSALHVHHRRYYRGRNPWEYTADELETLCENCHTARHATLDLMTTLLASDTGPQLVGLCAGWLLAAGQITDDDVTTLLGAGCPGALVAGQLARVSYDHRQMDGAPLSMAALAIIADIAR